MYNKSVVIECKHCKIKETIHTDYLECFKYYKPSNFFVIPTNIQCKKCFGLANIYVKDDKE